MEYVIQLTSGKDKHKNWADVTASWYRIYEVIDITENPVKPYDIIVKIKNQDILKKIDKEYYLFWICVRCFLQMKVYIKK